MQHFWVALLHLQGRQGQGVRPQGAAEGRTAAPAAALGSAAGAGGGNRCDWQLPAFLPQGGLTPPLPVTVPQRTLSQGPAAHAGSCSVAAQRRRLKRLAPLQLLSWGLGGWASSHPNRAPQQLKLTWSRSSSRRPLHTRPGWRGRTVEHRGRAGAGGGAGARSQQLPTTACMPPLPCLAPCLQLACLGFKSV